MADHFKTDIAAFEREKAGVVMLLQGGGQVFVILVSTMICYRFYGNVTT